jgi:hypothetical protein
MRQRPCQHRAVDAAGGGAGDDVDDDAQIDLVADIAQQFEIDGFGIEGPARLGAPGELGARPRRPIADVVQRARGAHQLQDLLADPVNVNGERDAAEADERDAQLFFTQSRFPHSAASGPSVSIAVCRGASRGRAYFHGTCINFL